MKPKTRKLPKGLKHVQLPKRVWILIDLNDDSYRLEFDTKREAMEELKSMDDLDFYNGIRGPICYEISNK